MHQHLVYDCDGMRYDARIMYLEMHCTCSTERVVMCKLKFEKKKDLNGTPVVKRRVGGLRSFDTVYLINQ